ncbi:MAG: CocE/NonD family hydrolase [Actinomycetota bacterium]
MTKRVLCLVLALLTSLALLSAAPSSARLLPPKGRAPVDYSKQKGLSQPRYKTVRETALVEMKDGINLYVEVVRPKGPGRFGTILELSPYHGTLADRSGTRILPGHPEGMAGYFAPRGYAVVFADLRGTGRSEGCLDHMGPNDQSDAYEIVEWAAKQKWSNGRVGMTGHSYVGSTPQMAAAQNPPHLKTIVPSAGLAAMYHHEFQDGVPYNLQWAGPLFAYEQLAIERHLPGGDNELGNMEYFGCGATQSAAVTGEAYFSGAETDWHRERDFRKGATKSKIPMFVVHGVNDNAARIAALDWFHARGGRPTDKAWIGQWDHGSGCCPNDRTCAITALPCEDDEWTTALHAWFDKHLLGRDADTGPAAEVFLNDGSIFTAQQWPPPVDRRLTLHPRGDGTLGPRPDDESSVSYVADPRGFENEFDTGNVAWTSGKMKKDTLLIGIPKMKLVTSVVGGRVHINATLYDVAPNDEVDRISRAGFAIQPELRDGWDQPAPVIPAERMTIDLEGMAQAHLLEKGHRLMLMVASSHPDKVPTFAQVAQVTVYTGGTDGTTVTLPVIYNPRLYEDHLQK